MYKAILFDFDGTLADTAPTIIQRFKETFALAGLPDRSEKEIRATIGLPLSTSFMKLQPTITADRALELCDIYREGYEEEAIKILRAFPGTEQVLRYLKDQGYKTAVVSSKKTDLIIEMTQALGISDLFDQLLGEDKVKHKKPAPDMALLGMELLKADKAETLVVGDSTYDIAMAKSAGVDSVWASYGYGRREDVLQLNPDYTIGKITDLLTIL